MNLGWCSYVSVFDPMLTEQMLRWFCPNRKGCGRVQSAVLYTGGGQVHGARSICRWVSEGYYHCCTRAPLHWCRHQERTGKCLESSWLLPDQISSQFLVYTGSLQ